MTAKQGVDSQKHRVPPILYASCLFYLGTSGMFH